MKKEIIACIDEKNIKYLHSGQISKYVFPMERKEAHERKIAHLIIRFFILSKTSGGKILYLVQKRGKNKESYPEYFTDSASGHVNYKNKLNLAGIKQNALRELEEEFGISRTSVKSIKFHELKVEKDDHNIEVAYIFIGLVEPDVTLIPDPNELDVKQSKFYKRANLEKILAEDNAVDHSKSIWRVLLNSNISELFDLDTQKSKQKKGTALFLGRF